MELLSLSEASRIIKSGGILIYPTETFFALGCDPACENAVEAIYAIKRRPLQKPLPLIAASTVEAAQQAELAECPQHLLTEFWPGPLSLILPIRRYLVSCLLNLQNKAAIRVSASETASTLARAAGGLITATSANIASQPPCKVPQELNKDLLEACAEAGLPWGIVSAKNYCHYSAPSTLVEPVSHNGGWLLRIIREGAIPRSALANSKWSLI